MKKSLLVIMLVSLANASPFMADIVFDFLVPNTEKLAAVCDSVEKIYEAEFGDECPFGSGVTCGCGSDSTVVNYISLLDTTVDFIYEKGYGIQLIRVTQNCLGVHSDSTSGDLAPHQFSEVLYAEIMRLYQYGVFEMDRDSLSFLLEQAIDSLKQNNRHCDDIDLAGLGIGPGCCSLVENGSAVLNVKLQAKSVRAIAVGKNLFRIQGVSPRSEYQLFDLNGRLLVKGSLKNGQLETPISPTILKVHGQKFLLNGL